MPLLSQVQAWARCPDHADDETTFALVTAAAIDAVIAILGYDPSAAQTTERYSGNATSMLTVNRRPITSVDAVSLIFPTNTQLLDPSQYTHDGDFVVMRICGWWPRGMRNVSIQYTAGLVTVPPSIVLAASMTVQAMWDGRAADQNSAGESFDGVLSQSWWPTGPGAVPPQARALLLPFSNLINAG